jgi:hypothetical protein
MEALILLLIPEFSDEDFSHDSLDFIYELLNEGKEVVNVRAFSSLFRKLGFQRSADYVDVAIQEVREGAWT